MPEADVFADVLAANAEYASSYRTGDLPPRAAKGLAVLTCMDSRIDPLAMLGLSVGDAKILRNPGGRVTDDVLETLVLARYLLGVTRVLVIPHTGCRMAAPNEQAVHAAIAESGGPDTRSLRFLTAPDQVAALADDVQRILSYPYLAGLEVGGFILDLSTGRIDAPL